MLLYDRGFNIGKNIKKILLLIVLVFILINTWVYSLAYKKYVSQAPVNLKEARKDYVAAIMFHSYYTFFVNTLGIDLLNPILYPVKEPRDYYYHRGLNKLPIDEGERALWFNLFEVVPYNYSSEGHYGSMVQYYGLDFTQVFVNKLYKNIEILSLNKISDPELKNIYFKLCEAYINMVDIYLYELHLNEDGYLYKDENIKRVATDFDLYKRLENIYKWHNTIIWRYKKENPNILSSDLNIKSKWSSTYKVYCENIFLYS
ncbi:hypothetical protein MNB_SM-4-610 [hydrothermal vent metagenome]|uniref:Uncharacterized protein n=1 Tax=hydrothermal vent metagenome TaxID=652676 RepID=A0A1W1CWG1_9ZZZZ